MSDHYYSPKPASAHQPFNIEAILRGKKFSFISDAGVFSRNGIDFGSELLIETMRIEPRSRVLDVGCGYGPIGLSAALLANEGTVTMVDINERAVELARENAKRNQIHNATVLQSDLLEAVKDRTFDCILTNPPIRAGKEIVHRIFEQSHQALASGGNLWVVIQKKQGAPSALSKLESLFDKAEEVERSRGYRILRCTRQ
jgi:16S rRNA (guanine1207-N2)-methyltransferase